MQNEYTTGADKPQPPRVGINGPRHDFGPTLTPADVLAALDILSRRRAAQVHRLSAITRLRGAAQ